MFGNANVSYKMLVLSSVVIYFKLAQSVVFVNEGLCMILDHTQISNADCKHARSNCVDNCEELEHVLNL